MKILMLGWELPPHNSGGLGVACYQLCKHLIQEGVEIDFVVPYADEHPDVDFMTILAATPHSAELLRISTSGIYASSEWEEEVRGGLLHGMPTSLRAQQKRYVEFIRQHTRENQYDAIHAHDWLTYEAGLIAQEMLRVPLVAHVHATEFDRAGGNHGNPLVHEIEYEGLLMADRIVAVSQATKDIIVSRYEIPANKIEVVHNAIDPTEFAPVERALSYPYLAHMKRRGYTVVASVGRLTLQKGLSFLLEAAQLAIGSNDKILIVLAGSGEQYHDLIEQAAELGISEHVLFTGFVRGQEWRDVFALADVFVMPSISEPFGLVALEAAGYGNAVVISRQSGVGEIMQHMLRFDFWDTHRLATQLVALAESEELREELRANCEQEFRQLSWAKVAVRCRELYENACLQGATA